jgi:anti-sigma factor RsiW
MVEREPSISEEQLHAYVDGQTAGDECAAVEKWLESHPDDAARVAAWRAQADAIRARYGAIANEPVASRFDLAKLARGDRRWSRRAVIASTIGTTIEWYDFFLYSTVTGPGLRQALFPHSDPLGRHAGGLRHLRGRLHRAPGRRAIFGHYGDRIGRKSTLIATLLLMGIATFLVALVPTYERSASGARSS